MGDTAYPQPATEPQARRAPREGKRRSREPAKPPGGRGAAQAPREDSGWRPAGRDDHDGDYDETVAQSFPASDPPPGTMHAGPPRRRR